METTSVIWYNIHTDKIYIESYTISTVDMSSMSKNSDITARISFIRNRLRMSWYIAPNWHAHYHSHTCILMRVFFSTQLRQTHGNVIIMIYISSGIDSCKRLHIYAEHDTLATFIGVAGPTYMIYYTLRQSVELLWRLPGGRILITCAIYVWIFHMKFKHTIYVLSAWMLVTYM